jgi:Putative MetA-pathway of phenol degradation
MLMKPKYFAVLIFSAASLVVNVLETKAQVEPSSLSPDKSQYHLFNPAPEKLWRDFATDRPDRTETPFTVDGGRFRMEADLFVYSKDIDRSNNTTTESYNYFVPNLKVGLTNNIDLQIIPEVYNVVRTKIGNQAAQSVSGFGDTTVRIKVNFWGNDSGDTAFGMIPFVKIPTSQNGIGNGSVEGGIIFPFAVKLSDTWDVGMQTQFDANKTDSGYSIGFVNTVSFGHAISDNWSTYFELYTNTGAERGFAATFDTGLKYLLTENVQLDGGVNIGLTEAADAIQPFLGLSVRF